MNVYHQLIAQLEQFYNDSPFYVKFNLCASLLFFLMIILFILFIVYTRYRKSVIEVKRKTIEKKLSGLINEYLFLDEYEEQPTENFKNYLQQQSLAKEVAIEQFLIFTENFRGDYIERLRLLFEKVGLADYLFHILKKGFWAEKVKAVYVLSELNIKKRDDLIFPLLLSDHPKLKAHAILYFVKTADNKPLSFLGHLQDDLSLWEQIHIEHILRYNYQGEMPNFSLYLKHRLETVRIFAVRMIRLFNQFESTKALIPMLKEEESEVKKEVIRTLTALNIIEALPFIIEVLKINVLLVQQEVLRAVTQMGNYEMLVALDINLNNPSLAFAFEKAKYQLKLH